MAERLRILERHGYHQHHIPKDDGVFVFQCLSWHADDAALDDDDGDDDDGVDDRAYRIRTFGVDATGQRITATIDGFQPYFFVRSSPASLAVQIRKWLFDVAGKHIDLVDVSPVRGVDFWGFTNGASATFLRCAFKTLRGMRIMASILQKRAAAGQVPASIGGEIQLYESNIDPLLRFFHTLSIEPAGWITVPAKFAVGRTFEPGHLQFSIRHWNAGGIAPLPENGQEGITPFLVASFDIECDSLHGDFPVACKDYRRLALDIDKLWELGAAGRCPPLKSLVGEYEVKQRLIESIREAFYPPASGPLLAHSLKLAPRDLHSEDELTPLICRLVDDICVVLRPKQKAAASFKKGGDPSTNVDDSSNMVDRILALMDHAFVAKSNLVLAGDSIIQIGVTVNIYGHRTASERYVFVLGSCPDDLGLLPAAVVWSCKSEAVLIQEWARFMSSLDPDVVTGYNIFGFDFQYIHDRAVALGVHRDLYSNLTRIPDIPSSLVVRETSSSAMGDNIMKFLEMPGRILIDLMKVVQRDHRLDSYKLDAVAKHFTGSSKDDVSPNDIFRLQKGTAEDRAVIARYCIQDCALCNELTAKLEILANNMAMANVCSVPLSHIFMRGQGVKIFSLVAKQCREDGFLIPTRKVNFNSSTPSGDPGDIGGYEGAIVLEPETGMYLETPVAVLDYNSLYPSSMISENISHDSLVMDPAYANVPGVEYVDISFDKYDTIDGDKVSVGVCTCRFAQGSEGRKAVLPRILESLLRQRKLTRARMGYSRGISSESGTEVVGRWDPGKRSIACPDGSIVPISESHEPAPAYSAFHIAVLDGMQAAYKTTANSLYGQMGSRTSPLYLREVAACTTATGRAMILKAKSFIETEFNGRVVYGDTDSLFVVFDSAKGENRLETSIANGQAVSRAIKPILKAPHNLEYEKTLYPLILLSKKRYVGLQYGDDPTATPVQKSMGIALKRRDYAPIVKRVYGGVIDIVLKEKDIPKAVEFLKGSLSELARGAVDLSELVISKTLRSHYKFPKQIAHCVLARRMYERDPGSAPQVNDRIPFVFVETSKKDALMGERIEHIDYVRSSGGKVRVDAKTYIENQLMKPCTQLLAIALEKLPGYVRNPEVSGAKALDMLIVAKKGDRAKAQERLNTLREREVERIVFAPILKMDEIRKSENRCKGQREISFFFQKKV